MKHTDLTAEEQQMLQNWIDEGNSPKDNPWFMAGEDGRPLDYICALRDMCDLELQARAEAPGARM